VFFRAPLEMLYETRYMPMQRFAQESQIFHSLRDACGLRVFLFALLLSGGAQRAKTDSWQSRQEERSLFIGLRLSEFERRGMKGVCLKSKDATQMHRW